MQNFQVITRLFYLNERHKIIHSEKVKKNKNHLKKIKSYIEFGEIIVCHITYQKYYKIFFEIFFLAKRFH